MFHHLARVVVVVMVVAGALDAQGAVARQSTEVYESPTYGFSVEWDPTRFEADPESQLTAVGPNQLDRLVLFGDGSTLYVEGLTNYDGVASTCADGEINALSAVEGVTDVVRLPKRDADGPGAAARAMELTVIGEDGSPLRVADYVYCVSLSDRAVAIFTLVTLAENLDAQLDLTEPIMTSLQLGKAPDSRTMTDASTAADASLLSEMLESSMSGPALAGPVSGEDALGWLAAEASDVVVGATFVNGEADLADDTVLAVALRGGEGAPRAELRIASDGAWELVLIDAAGQETVAMIGTGPALKATPGDGNAIAVATYGPVGWFSVNGEYVSALDLQDLLGPGNVAVMIEGDPSVTVADLTVWPLAVPAVPEEMTADAFRDWVIAVRAMPPITPFRAGWLDPADPTGELASAPAGVRAADALMHVRWANPADPGPWEIAVGFRTEYLLMLDSSGAWTLRDAMGDVTASGAVDAMVLTPGGVNVLDLGFVGASGGFAVNDGEPVMLDLSADQGAGDIILGSGLTDAAASVAKISYREFAVWEAAGAIPMRPMPVPEPLPRQDIPPVETSTEDVLAVTIDAESEGGPAGIATLREVEGEAQVTVAVTGTVGSEVVVVHRGTCADIDVDPAVMLGGLNEAGTSVTQVGIPLADLLGEGGAIVVHAGIDDFGTVLACGDLPQPHRR